MSATVPVDAPAPLGADPVAIAAAADGLGGATASVIIAAPAVVAPAISAEAAAQPEGVLR